MPKFKPEDLGSIFMISATVLALILANTTSWYQSFISAPLSLFTLTDSVQGWTKSALMSIFFLHITLELKYEMVEGFLSNRKHVLLPAVAALGGMLVPALIYLGINHQHPENWGGFAIPCATDIAFSLCLFHLFGKRLPPSIRVFLLSIAIFDDLGAILIITLFYNATLHSTPLFISFGITGILWKLHQYRITFSLLYLFLGILLWIALYQAGMNTTLSGVILGLCIPLYKKTDVPYLKSVMAHLNPWVQWGILPLFAFTASGVLFNTAPNIISDPLILGIGLGLLLGKPLGIFLFSYGLIRLQWAPIPSLSQYRHIFIIALLCGFGFTMSLFMGILAFSTEIAQNAMKLGVLLGSTIAALMAVLVILLTQNRR